MSIPSQHQPAIELLPSQLAVNRALLATDQAVKALPPNAPETRKVSELLAMAQNALVTAALALAPPSDRAS